MPVFGPLPEPPVVPPGAIAGTVRISWPEREGPPVAGARVQLFLSDGEAEATTDAAGQFSFTQPGGSGDLLITAPGFAPTLIAGWDGASELTLHLATANGPPQTFEATVPVAGRVLYPDGAPAEGAVVIGSDGAGSSFGPFLAGADGRYQGFATSAAGPAISNMAVWAYTLPAGAELTGLGLATDVAIGPGAPPAEIRLQAALGEVHLAPRGPAGLRSASVVAEAANGATVVLRAWSPGQEPDACPYFEVPGGTLAARVLVESPDGTARSEWRDVIAGPGDLAPTLLGYPGPIGLPAGGLQDGGLLRWGDAEGASAYRVALRADDHDAPTWEAYAAGPGLVARGLPAAPGATLEVTALAGAAAGIRQVASVDGLRQLRWPVPASGKRTASRKLALLPP